MGGLGLAGLDSTKRSSIAQIRARSAAVYAPFMIATISSSKNIPVDDSSRVSQNVFKAIPASTRLQMPPPVTFAYPHDATLPATGVISEI